MKIKYSLSFLIASLLLILISANAAEVFYLSGASPDTTAAKNPSYSLSQRIKDLFDFFSGRDYKERSGKISGIFSQEIDYNKVSGNKAKSFLEEGFDYNSELNINAQEKLWNDYNFEGKWFLRKTDDRRIEPRRDLRLKEINLRVFNPNNLFEFGDFYADFSQFVVGSSLEGFNFELSPNTSQKYKFFAARKNRKDTTTATFQRNAFGIKGDWHFFENSDKFSNFRLGIQVASSQDDSSTVERAASTKDLSNIVASIDGEIALRKVFSLQYEIARSYYLEDEDTYNDEQFGTAFRMQPALNFNKVSLRYLYYYVQPKFYTELGSAAADKIQHQISFDYKISEKIIVNLVENYYWDHLKGSLLTKRTTNDEKYITLNLKPFNNRKSFTIRPYFNYLEKDSDDLQNSAESLTRTAGFGINDVLDEKTSYSFNYEYRAFTDQANHTSSDYFHRLSASFSHEQKFFNKRLYYSISPSADLRNSKSSEKKDVNLNLSFNGQYDIFANLVSRFGYNLQDSNNARPNQDFVNHVSFLEFDFNISQKLGTHFIIRYERNRYDHQDGNQDYKETRVIAKFVSNF